MGLDMYLKAREYVSRADYVTSNFDRVENELFNTIINALDFGTVIEPEGFAGIEIEVPIGYWRKVNHIHAWFVKNLANGVDECQPIYASRDNLQTLKDTCEAVLAMRGRGTAGEMLAKEVLPPQEGFFFGTYEIDEWYYSGLEYTIEMLTRILADERLKYFVYQASW
jgi:hypothetical protein